MNNPSATGHIVLELQNIKHSFHQGRESLNILKGIDLTVRAGEIIALVGQSGSGKSTLLNMAGLLETPEFGEIIIQGRKCVGLNDRDRTAIRREELGFVYQQHHLLPEFNALENISVSQIIKGFSRHEAKIRAEQVLEWMGLKDRALHRPARLSGGEQQRVAIARAIAPGPQLLLADEPTGNLDPETAHDVFSIFLKLVRRSGMAALIATHNPEIAAQMDRTVNLVDGHLVT